MSYITKLIIRILSRTQPEIEQEQCGIVQDSGTGNVTFMVRMLSE